MDYKNNPRFCLLPFFALNTRPNGQIKPCSEVMNMPPIKKNTTVENLVESKNPHHNLTKDTLEEVWNSSFMQDMRMKMINGEYIKFCETCYQLDQNNVPSKRETVIKKYYEDNKHLVQEAIKNNGKMETMPNWWELRLSSICNEACRMCIPQTSSKMREEFSKFIDELPESIKNNTKTAKLNFDKFGYLGDNKEFMKEFYNNLKDIKYIELHGGEPTTDKNLWKAMKFIVDSGHASHIYLHVHTNIHSLTEHHIKLWNQFKSGWIGVSIDAYGKENEYIRHGSIWQKVEKNLILLKGLGPHWSKLITSTVMVYNACTMDKFVEWFINYTKINDMPDLKWYAGQLVIPELMRLEHIPLEMREKYIDNIKKYIGKHSDITDKAINDVISMLQSKHVPDKISFKELIDYTKILDKKRNQSLEKIFPHLKELFNG